ncbi:acyl--CoA ligase family protein [Blastococcus capsensis]|uniref:acyl--CoA ligase family protein n=1 Tax=Blastococcus capsensis TaxID=1564163 RepID=UPI00253FD2B6|nr:acyl--CoA ligase family protein [Blastococcus capsensis]MDK3256490.1 acyl--CoA ligase family protein [Blastococcus capsensis]
MASFTFSQLSPTAYLERSARVFPDRTAIIDGDRRSTYREFADRSRRLAGGLAARGIAPGDRVAALCANSATMLELHNGIPWAGAVIVPLNTRLSPGELGYVLEHSGASLLVADPQFAATATEVAAAVGVPLVLAGDRDSEYEQLLAGGEPLALPCADETGLLALNYTSGTTGRPKGVMYAHRGAYLQALAMAMHTGLGSTSQYLWTLPMFHCNGWCFPWAVSAAGATHVCLPRIEPARIWQLLRTEGITHFSAAPTVLTMILNADEAAEGPVEPRVEVQTGGAPPTPTLLARMSALNMDVTHLYGLTETYGPLALNEWHPEWDDLDTEQQAELKARQGVGNVVADPLRVVDDKGADVPRDATTVGEIVARGNDVMLGYYRDDEATAAVTLADADGQRGWFRTGDLAVVHPDGYVEIRDRSKDIIISGGENISSVEVERALDAHAAVAESAVVAEPHEKWGEVPVAYVTLRAEADVTDQELADFVRSRLASFKVPKRFVRGDLPKTSTGKVQKNLLREQHS